MLNLVITISPELSTVPCTYRHSINIWWGASLVAQMVKNLPAMRETQVRSMSWEDPLEKGMAIHSSILAWRIPRTEEPGGLPVIIHGVTKSQPRLEWSTLSQLFKKKKVNSINAPILEPSAHWQGMSHLQALGPTSRWPWLWASLRYCHRSSWVSQVVHRCLLTT